MTVRLPRLARGGVFYRDYGILQDIGVWCYEFEVISDAVIFYLLIVLKTNQHWLDVYL